MRRRKFKVVDLYANPFLPGLENPSSMLEVCPKPTVEQVEQILDLTGLGEQTGVLPERFRVEYPDWLYRPRDLNTFPLVSVTIGEQGWSLMDDLMAGYAAVDPVGAEAGAYPSLNQTPGYSRLVESLRLLPGGLVPVTLTDFVGVCRSGRGIVMPEQEVQEVSFLFPEQVDDCRPNTSSTHHLVLQSNPDDESGYSFGSVSTTQSIILYGGRRMVSTLCWQLAA